MFKLVTAITAGSLLYMGVDCLKSREHGLASSCTFVWNSEKHGASLEDRVYNMIASEFEVSRGRVTRGSRLVQDLGADSLDLVELILRAEETFAIKIPDEDAEKVQTAGDLFFFIRAKSNWIDLSRKYLDKYRD